MADDGGPRLNSSLIEVFGSQASAPFAGSGDGLSSRGLRRSRREPEVARAALWKRKSQGQRIVDTAFAVRTARRSIQRYSFRRLRCYRRGGDQTGFAQHTEPIMSNDSSPKPSSRWDVLTRTGAGTPMGELLRRYWWPIAGASELEKPGTLAGPADGRGSRPLQGSRRQLWPPRSALPASPRRSQLRLCRELRVALQLSRLAL